MADDDKKPEADEEDDEETKALARVLRGREKGGSKNPKVQEAKDAAELAKQARIKAEEEKKLKDLNQPKSKLDRQISHHKKEKELYKEKNEHHEARQKYREAHGSVGFNGALFGGMALAFVAMCGLALAFDENSSPNEAIAAIKDGAYQVLVFVFMLGTVVFFLWLFVQMVRSGKGKKKEAAGHGHK